MSDRPARPRPRYFTETDIAERFRVSLRQVQRWVAAGLFENVLRISAKIVRIPYESVLAFEARYLHAA
jgi:hypothetical protein